MNLSVNNPCKYCTEQGCGIYETRPENPCRTFKCAWLQEGSPLPEHLQPNRSLAIIMLDRTWRDDKVIVALPVGAKIPQKTLDWLMTYAQQNRRPLVFLENLYRDGNHIGAKQTGFGPPAFVEHVKNSMGTEDIFHF
jgi:hypothetical protein